MTLKFNYNTYLYNSYIQNELLTFWIWVVWIEVRRGLFIESLMEVYTPAKPRMKPSVITIPQTATSNQFFPSIRYLNPCTVVSRKYCWKTTLKLHIVLFMSTNSHIFLRYIFNLFFELVSLIYKFHMWYRILKQEKRQHI